MEGNAKAVDKRAAPLGLGFVRGIEVEIKIF